MGDHGNMLSVRGVSASGAVQQAAFRIGVDDWRKGRPMRSGHELPPLVGITDGISNRERIYEIGRFIAIYARRYRRAVNRATAIAAKRDGYF